MDLKLTGKRALITGSSSGIGAAIARMLAVEGALVVVHGRTAERAGPVAEQIAMAGGRAAIATGDLATEAGAAETVRAATAAFGGIDILVGSVGGPLSTSVKSWFDISIDDWNATFQSNVVSALRMAHAFAPEMKARGWGRIIHISSRNAKLPRPTLAAYAASKAALANMTISLSKALACTGVTVNCISPGLIYTPMLDRWLAAIAEQQGFDGDLDRARDHAVKHMVRQTVGRLGEPDDIARAVAFLASPYSDFVNGIDMDVDGGALPAG